MPLPAFCRSLLVVLLAAVPAFAGPVSEVPPLAPSVNPAGTGAVGSFAAAGSFLQGSAPGAGLALTPSVLPTLAPAPKAAASAVQAASALPVPSLQVQPVSLPARSAAAAVAPKAGVEPSSPAPVTVREQLKTVSEKTGAAVEALQAPGGGSDADAERAGAKTGALFDASKPGAFVGLDAVSAADAEAAPSPLGLLSRAASSKAAADPDAFRALVLEELALLRKPTGNALKGREAYARGRADEIVRLQKAFQAGLLSGARAELRRRGIQESEVVSHGTTLKGLLGMLFSGGIEATSSYRGMSGEGAHVWGAPGVETGASYGGVRGIAQGQPGVVVLIHNPKDPIRVVQGEIMSRAPTAGEDFAAVVISDGERTVTLDREGVRALAASAAQWRARATAAAYKGDMRAFTEWERMRDLLEPDYFKGR